MTPLLAQRPRADRSFERMYQRHVGDVYRYALAVLRNPADAEDVTQTTFLNAYRAYQRGERPRAAQNWLIAIAHNVCRQRFRQTARRPEEVAFDEGIGDAQPEAEQGPSAEDIQRALGELAFNQRAALVMRELEGRSYAEIAQILGLSVSAVETLIFRARRALREQLEGTLTCHAAELAISKQADGRLPRSEKGALRAHLRACKQCERFARSQRAQRTALKALAAVPVPTSLSSFFGAAGATAGAAGTALGVKAAAVLATGAVAAGVAYEGARRVDPGRADEPRVAVAVTPTVTPSARAAASTPVASDDPPAGVRHPRATPARAHPQDARPKEARVKPKQARGKPKRRGPKTGRPQRADTRPTERQSKRAQARPARERARPAPPARTMRPARPAPKREQVRPEPRRRRAPVRLSRASK